MTTDKIGLYVHIPFCVRKCNYCDFCSYPGRLDDAADAYIDALIKEAELYRENRYKVDTLYIGGGTPSLLSGEQLSRLILALGSIFDFAKELDFTLEANPGTLDREKALLYRELGVNRISLGVQSIHENELISLGRIHTFEDFLSAYSMLREVGFDNINLDIMYAIPEQTEASLKETLNKLLSLSPEHISAYSLIVEEGTPFYRDRDRLPLPNEDTELNMYRLITDTLRAAGFSHYEISNYAKAGYKSKHNLKYWRCEHYIGLGASAHSYIGKSRYSNPSSLDEYIRGTVRQEKALLSRDDEMLEYAMLRLRLSEGISLSDYEERFGVPFLPARWDKVKGFIDLGYLSLSDDMLAITESGFYVSNYIMAEIL